MDARATISPPPGGGISPRETASRLAIADRYVLQAFTPSSAADATAPNVKFAADDSYLYVQISDGVWKRAALSTW